MKKKISKIISVVLSMIMLVSVCPISSVAASNAARIIDKDGNELGVYQYFSDAIRAVQLMTGKPTVILNNNVNIGGTNSVTQGDFILDLNGCTITSSDFATPFDIGSGVKVKIIDSGEDGKIVSNYAVAIDNEGDLTLEDGTITGKGCVNNKETGYFEVLEDGILQSKSLPAIENSGEIGVGGTVTSTGSYGVKNKGESSYVDISGYVSGISAVYNEDGYCGLFGGEIVGSAGPAIVAEAGTVDFIGLEDVSGTDPDGVTGIVDGEFTADIGKNATVLMYGGDFPNGIVLHGRTINECLYEDAALYDENDKVIHLADDATSVEGFVKIKQYFQASVRKTGSSLFVDSGCKTFEEAVNRAVTYNTGAIITLHDDITLDAVIEIPSGIMTIDLNGYVLTSETGTVFNVGADADVTIKDSKEGDTIECTATDEEGNNIPVIYNYGTLTVDSGNFVGDFSTDGALTINGGTFGETDIVFSETATITVNGGTFEHLDYIFDKEGQFSLLQIVMEGGTFTTGIKTNVGSLHDFTGQTKRFFDAEGEPVYTPSNTSNYRFYATIDEFIAAQVIDADGVTVGNYSTVELALSAAFDHDGSTVKMINDTYMWGFQNTTQSAEVTLDLNGKTITYGYGGYAIFLDRREVVFNIKDSAGGGMLLGDYRSSAGFNFPYLLYIKQAAEVNIYGGTILRKSSGTTTKPEKLYAIINDSNNTAPNVLNIYGGRIAVEAEMEYSHNSCTIFNEGTLNIYGGEIYNDKKTAIESGFKSTVNVYGGRIASDGGCAVYDREDGFGGINIYGGTVSGATSTFSRNTDSFKVFGGYFPRGISIENRNADDTLYLKDLLAEGVNYYDIRSEIIDVADDQLSIEEYVEVRDAFAARVMDGKTGETTHYKTFEEALAASQQDGNKTVLTLLEDVTLESPVEFTSGIVTLDLNGKTILQTEDDHAVIVGENANVTIRDYIGTGEIITEAEDTSETIVNYGRLVIEDGKIQGTSCVLNNWGTLIIYGGEFVSSDVSFYNYSGDAKIYGGIFKADVVTDVYMLIGGGIFECEKITINDEWVEIKGGTFGIEKIVFGDGSTASLSGGEFINGIVLESPDNFHTLYGICNNFAFFRDENGEIISLDWEANSYDSYIKVSYGASLTDDAVIEIEDEYVYGDDIDVKIFIGNIQLWEDDHYTLSYTGDGNIGTQMLVIYGINGIEGTIVKDIEIVPREVEISWSADDMYMENIVFQYDGNPHTVTAGFINEHWTFTDVEVQNGTNTEVGRYTATAILDNPNYVIKEGTGTCTYRIIGDSVTISGTAVSYGDAAHRVDLILYNEDGGFVQSTGGLGNSIEYSFDTIEAGTYTLTVSKQNHVTREYEIVVEDDDIVQDVKIQLIGDVNGDGRIMVTDYSAILRHVKKTSLLTGYELICADVNSDGRVMVTDYSAVLRHVKKTATLW